MSVTIQRVCPWCGQRRRVIDGLWEVHVDPNIVPKGSGCDGAGQPYIRGQRVTYASGWPPSRAGL